jgi:hypothetical protein
MKKLLPIFLLLFSFLSSCTAENNEEALICKALYISGDTSGFEIIALFTTSGGNTMESDEVIEKVYDGKSADEAIDNLLKDEKDALFKPTKILVLKKNGKYNAEIAKAYLNRSELQLKCMVYESENGFSEIEGKGISFPEYYRKITEGKYEY